MTIKKIHPAAVVVPELAIDKLMADITPVHARGRGERRVFAALVQHLEANGFVLHSVFDGDDETLVATKQEAMELVFNLDEASVRFMPRMTPGGLYTGRNKRAPWHGILIVLGNSPEEIVSDYNYSADDADGFNAVMEAFDSELYA
jgi:hypothetical protein